VETDGCAMAAVGLNSAVVGEPTVFLRREDAASVSSGEMFK
jgi:hypothetical protein